MVLRTKVIAILFLLFSTGLMFSQETRGGNYAVSVIGTVLRESPEGIIIRNNVDASGTAISQQEKSWLPSVQLDFSADSRLVQGEYRYIKNGYSFIYIRRFTLY